jgi:phosphoglycolate phosphatase
VSIKQQSNFVDQGIAVVVFDFDGVLVQSNQVKEDGFRIAFEDLDVPQAFIDACRAVWPDGNRFQIIREMIQRLRNEEKLGTSASVDDQVADYAERYNDICENYASTCPEVRGATDTLRTMSNVIPLYVNSLTLETPLRRIVEKRGWTVFFRNVLGSPRNKIENLQSILQAENVEASGMLFVGDGARDQRAALEVGCRFVGVRNSFNDFASQPETMIDGLDELPPLMKLVPERCDV